MATRLANRLALALLPALVLLGPGCGSSDDSKGDGSVIAGDGGGSHTDATTGSATGADGSSASEGGSLSTSIPTAIGGAQDAAAPLDAAVDAAVAVDGGGTPGTITPVPDAGPVVGPADSGVVKADAPVVADAPIVADAPVAPPTPDAGPVAAVCSEAAHFEPNNTETTACTLDLGKVVDADVAMASDANDYYTVPVKKGVSYSLSIINRSTAAMSSLMVRVTQQDGLEPHLLVSDLTLEATKSATPDFKPSADGMVIIHVWTDRPAAAYRLSLVNSADVKHDPGTYEPNDSLSTASALPGLPTLDSTLTFPVDSIDYFTFPVDKGDYVATVTNHATDIAATITVKGGTVKNGVLTSFGSEQKVGAGVAGAPFFFTVTAKGTAALSLEIPAGTSTYTLEVKADK